MLAEQQERPAGIVPLSTLWGGSFTDATGSPRRGGLAGPDGHKLRGRTAEARLPGRSRHLALMNSYRVLARLAMSVPGAHAPSVHVARELQLFSSSLADKLATRG